MTFKHHGIKLVWLLQQARHWSILGFPEKGIYSALNLNFRVRDMKEADMNKPGFLLGM